MIFISLGVNCFTASALKLYNLKKCSYMFDWSCTNVDNVITIMKNYNIENYQKLINNPWKMKGDTSYGLLTFVHHNDISYRERTIKRFFNVLDSDDNKVFIITVQQGSWWGKGNKYDIEKIKEIYNLLERKTKNFKLICINVFDNLKEDIHTLNYIENNEFFELWEMRTKYSTPWVLPEKEKYNIFSNFFKKYTELNNLDNLKDVKTPQTVSEWNNL